MQLMQLMQQPLSTHSQYHNYETSFRYQGSETHNVNGTHNSCNNYYHTLCVTGVFFQDMVYMLPCKAVLGWTSNSDALKLYYDTGKQTPVI